MVCLPASYVFSGRFDIESGPPSIPQGQNLSQYFDLVAFLSQLFKIPFVQLLGQAVFLNYAQFVPLNTTVEPALKATSDHNNHLSTTTNFFVLANSPYVESCSNLAATAAATTARPQLPK